VLTGGTRIHCGLQDQIDLVEQEIQGLLREFWYATNSNDLRLESCIDRERGISRFQLVFDDLITQARLQSNFCTNVPSNYVPL
jgi:hypothetical protein